MAKVPNGVETLPKISIASVGCSGVHERYRRQTDRRTDLRRHIANVNMSSASVASSAVFPPNWAFFQTHSAGNFWRSRVAVFWAVSELAAGIGQPGFEREPMVS